MFAAACAERLQPFYAAFHRASGQGSPEQLRQALEAVWAAAADGDQGEDVAHWESVTYDLVPQEEDPGWADVTPLGENAATAVAYALRTWSADDPQEAAWAARHVYEAADYAAQRQLPDLDLNGPGAEDELLGRSVVQEALTGLQADLSAVSATDQPDRIVARGLRERAGQGGERLARLATF